MTTETTKEFSALDSELIQRIKQIQIRAQFLVNNSFSGEYLSAFKGHGLEFDELRQYVPGDDVRKIDWNVTARMNQPYIKTHKDERELIIVFLVDVSASTVFGSQNKLKSEIAAEVSALLAYTALRNNDKIGLIAFSDRIEHHLPPKKGRGHIWKLIQDILSYQSMHQQTNINSALDFLNQVQKKKAIVFLFSDLICKDWETKLRTTSKRHEINVISISDPREESFPNIGFVEMKDLETNETKLVNTNSWKFSDKMQKAYQKNENSQKKNSLKKNGISFLHLKTNENYMDPLLHFFHQRKRKL